MTDHLEAAQESAGPGYVNEAVMHALVSIATDVRRIADRLDTNTADLYASGVLAGATVTAESLGTIMTTLGVSE